MGSSGNFPSGSASDNTAEAETIIIAVIESF